MVRNYFKQVQRNEEEVIAPEVQFDAAAFTGDSSEEGSGGSGEFSWESPVETPIVETPVAETPIVEAPIVQPITTVPSVGTFDYKAYAKDLEIEEDVPDAETFKTKLSTIIQENKRLRSSVNDVVQNETIKRLSGFKAMTDEDLVIADLKGMKMNEDEVRDIIDTHKENNTLRIEALKIRKFVDSKIEQERALEAQKLKSNSAKQSEEQQAARKEFKELVDKTETMFGFKLHSDPSKLPEVRKNHNEYVTSGTFMQELFKSSESLFEGSWLYKNRHVIMKALERKGIDTGRAEVLNKIHLPESSVGLNLPPPKNPDEFDATAFARD